jgi:hypothetical protein
LCHHQLGHDCCRHSKIFRRRLWRGGAGVEVHPLALRWGPESRACSLADHPTTTSIYKLRYPTILSSPQIRQSRDPIQLQEMAPMCLRRYNGRERRGNRQLQVSQHHLPTSHDDEKMRFKDRELRRMMEHPVEDIVDRRVVRVQREGPYLDSP